ncbi:MAG: hypothetical protein K9N46_07275 [Candidatus Marinimicrobia bacterium]|nr:hypothetical protein [Candidatus Neomarinimicrobiota bacterium]MCF7880523.1 hypothetical protein [Candidatus Neomarinimicrobiota bacterium]
MRYVHLIIGLLFCTSISQAVAETSVESIDIDFAEKNIDLIIATDGTPEYQVIGPKNGTIRIRIDDAAGYDFHRSDNPLWTHAPFGDISLSQQYKNIYLAIQLNSLEDFTLKHTHVENGIRLSFSGEPIGRYLTQKGQNRSNNLAKVLLDENIFKTTNIGEKYSKYSVKNLNRSLEKHIGENDLSTVQALHTEFVNRDALTPSVMKDLAEFYDARGLSTESEQMWIAYYKAKINQNSSPYVDALPGEERARSNIEAQTLAAVNYLNENRVTIGIFLLLSMISTGGYYLTVSRNSGEVEFQDIPKEQSRDFLSALQSQMGAEVSGTGGEEMDSMNTQSKKSPVTEIDQGNASGDSVSFSGFAEANKPSDNNQISRKRKEVARLHKKGLSREMIARELNLSKGEVELLLKVSQKTKSAGPGANRVNAQSFAGMSVREIARELAVSEEEAKLIRMRGKGA